MESAKDLTMAPAAVTRGQSHAHVFRAFKVIC